MNIEIEIAENLFYDKDSGNLVWSKNQRGHARKGDLVGTVMNNGCGKKYLAMKFRQRRLLVHRVIWFICYGRWPEKFIDHINGNGLDNRILNLREVSRTENQRNQKLSKRNKTGVMGVSEVNGKFLVNIGSRENKKRIGLFPDFFEAVCARKSEELKRNYHENHGSDRSI